MPRIYGGLGLYCQSMLADDHAFQNQETGARFISVEMWESAVARPSTSGETKLVRPCRLEAVFARL